MAHTLEYALADTSYDLELDKIKNKIQKLYRDLLVKTFKMANPNATPEELANFLEKNDLDFKGNGFEEESEDLENLLDMLSKEDDLESVTDKNFEKPEVEKTKELKSKSKEKTTVPSTLSLKVPTGGLFTPKDLHKIPKTKSLKTPTGKVKRVIDDKPKVKTIELKEIWDSERQKLLDLVKERNKEYGVIL